LAQIQPVRTGVRSALSRIAARLAKGDRPYLVLLVALVCSPLYPVLLGGLCLYNGDIGALVIPLRGLADQALRAGHLPLWVNNIFCGFPLLASGEVGIFDPVRLLLAFLTSSARVVSLALPVHVSIAAIFTYALGRRLGLAPLAAVLAGVTYTLGGAGAAHQGHPTMAAGYWALPAGLLVADHLRASPPDLRRAPWAFLLGIVVAVSILAAQPQMAFVAALYSLVYFVGAFEKSHSGVGRRQAVGVGLLLVAGLGLCAVQALPTLEFGHLSWRESGDRVAFMTSFSFPLAHLVTFLLPTFFGAWGRPYWGSPNVVELHAYLGLLPLLLAPLALRTWREPRVRGLLAVLVVSVVLMLGPGNPLYLGLQYVPGMNVFRVPARHLFGVGLAVSLLAGLGLTQLTRRDSAGKPISLRATLVVVGVAVLLYAAIAADLWVMPPLSTRQAFPEQRPLLLRDTALLLGVLALGVVVIWTAARSRLRSSIAQTVVLAAAFADLTYFFPRINNFVPPSFYDSPPQIVRDARNAAPDSRCLPLRRGRGSSREERLLIGSGPALWGLKSVTGRAALATDRHTRLFAGNDLRVPPPLPMPLLSSLNVGTIIAKEDLVAPDLRLVSRQGQWRLYANHGCLPRAWLVGKWQVAGSPDEAWTAVVSRDFSPATTAVLEAPPSLPQTDEPAGPVIVERDAGTRLVLRTSDRRPRLLVLADQWYPGWVARVDGRPTPIYRANYLVRAIEVPAGDHTILFSYEPASYRLGRAISLLSLLVGLGVAITGLRGRFRDRTAAAGAGLPDAGGSPS
jgi:hypothetical protein